MILLFDMGNTRVKYALLHDSELIAGNSIAHREIGALDKLLHGIVEIPEGIYLATVADKAVADRLSDACSDKWGIKPILLSSTQQCGGVSNGYRRASTLGVDRWAAMIGAYHLVNTALLVVDCGTACTADLLDSDGRHVGGAIVPGLQMMRDSLDTATSGVGKPAATPTYQEWGASTAECIESGVTASLAAFVEKMAARARNRAGNGVVVLLTGGDAPKLLDYLDSEVRYEKDLVLLGMAAMVAQKGGNVPQ